MRVAVLVTVCATVVFVLRTSFPLFASGLLGLGVGLIAADFAARPLELGTLRGTFTLARFAELMGSLWTRFGLCLLAFPNLLLLPFCALSTLVIAMRSAGRIWPYDALFVGLGLSGLIGSWAIGSGVLLSYKRFRSSKKLYWLTLFGLIAAVITALPLSQIGPRVMWPVAFPLLPAIIFVVHYMIAGVFLILALLGGRQHLPRAQRPNSTVERDGRQQAGARPSP